MLASHHLASPTGCPCWELNLRVWRELRGTWIPWERTNWTDQFLLLHASIQQSLINASLRTRNGTPLQLTHPSVQELYFLFSLSFHLWICDKAFPKLNLSGPWISFLAFQGKNPEAIGSVKVLCGFKYPAPYLPQFNSTTPPPNTILLTII